MLESITLRNFTAFTDLSLEFTPGVNLFIGENGTGKTHLLKVLYAALSSQRGIEQTRGDALARKLQSVFLPRNRQLGRLVHRVKGGATSQVAITRDGRNLTFEFTNQAQDDLTFRSRWSTDIAPSVYIPVKEMLANAPGFRSLYSMREIHFEEVYADIIDKAYLPILKGAPSRERKMLLEMLQQAMDGRVVVKGEQFFLRNKQGELEFTLLAEGLRKLALLWLLIQNGTLLAGSTLFWDEPEANLNPSLIHTLVEILLHLQAQGVQLFIATHSYVVLREFGLHRTSDNRLSYFVLERDEERGVVARPAVDEYVLTLPNPVSDAYQRIYDEELQRSLGVKL